MSSLTWLTIPRVPGPVSQLKIVWCLCADWCLSQVSWVFSFFLASPLVICTGAKRLGKPATKAKSKSHKVAVGQQPAGSNKQNLLPALMHQLNFLIIFAMAFCSCSCQLHAALFAQLPGRAIFSSRSYESSRVESSIFESRQLPSPTRLDAMRCDAMPGDAAEPATAAATAAAACVYWYVFIIELVFNKKWSQLS